ncbi:Dynactin subunit 6, variant 3 [Entomophthora muscae]|uniref:Dynactin subunit 6, variant 3 n=1 Tax=Entomophthora muscae TaxID=34485 RepID=A0ACC2RJ63_9FUNG|nr:Dynactin subunit 6, variant 3 [Entomophthora muscae]
MSESKSEPQKNNFKVASTSVMCDDVIMSGSVTIGSNNVFNHKCKILAETAPIIFGEGNVVEEHAVIINRSNTPMIIGNENYIESGAYVESSSIGNQNHIEPKARILSGTVIHNSTVVGANCYTEPGSVLEDLTTIYGDNNTRRKQYKQSFVRQPPFALLIANSSTFITTTCTF